MNIKRFALMAVALVIMSACGSNSPTDPYDPGDTPAGIQVLIPTFTAQEHELRGYVFTVEANADEGFLLELDRAWVENDTLRVTVTNRYATQSGRERLNALKTLHGHHFSVFGEWWIEDDYAAWQDWRMEDNVVLQNEVEYFGMKAEYICSNIGSSKDFSSGVYTEEDCENAEYDAAYNLTVRQNITWLIFEGPDQAVNTLVSSLGK